jgi:hypothetical protein
MHTTFFTFYTLGATNLLEFQQGILTEGERLSTADLLMKVSTQHSIISILWVQQIF